MRGPLLWREGTLSLRGPLLRGTHMIDATPSATPMPAPPVATVTSTETPSPPADPPPVFVPPSVTDPVSNLDFLPIDDAFALEMRAESIEQLVGDDALRRGESERIEAGRSQTNADLVAGRDRVRVHATLHEHTGRGLAEQAAHLHTAVDGALDVHAASEDTVLLAGHMRDLWDGGAAIVAAMADDTVAGGGIRVTTPLDLWVHGLMGVEERIGTCTADAVLLELGATHYEREYGPGVHAAGLAAYTGSLYQSSRSTFRPLMRVSRGVRNLIAGSDGGDGGGDGSARSAPGASPPPVPAETGAAEESVTGTLAAGRRAVEAPATAPDTADGLTGAQPIPLETLVDSVDARAGEEMGGAGTVLRAEDLPELTRYADTAERLGALQETLRMDATESASEAAGGFRASKFEGAVSMHPATGGGGPLEIDPPSAVDGDNAPVIPPHPGAPWGQGPEMKLGLLGGADRPPGSAVPESDFPAAYNRLRDLRRDDYGLSQGDIARDLNRTIQRLSRKVRSEFESFGGTTANLASQPADMTMAERAYLLLQETVRQAERDGDFMRARMIRNTLIVVDELAVEALQAITSKFGIAAAPSTQAIRRPPVTAGPTTTVAAIQPPAHTPIQFDWIPTYRQLRHLFQLFSNAGMEPANSDFRAAASRMSIAVMRRFRKFDRNPEHLLRLPRGVTKAEQAYRAIEGMFRRANESRDAARAYEIRHALVKINQLKTNELRRLTTKYGAFDALSTQATQAVQGMQTVQAMHVMQIKQTLQTLQTMRPVERPPVTVASTSVASAGRLDIPGPAHPIAPSVNPASPEPAGGLVHATDVSGPPPASSLPGPSLSEAAGARRSGAEVRPVCLRSRHHGRASGCRRGYRHALAHRDVLVLAATGRPGADAALRSLRLRSAPRRRDRATPSGNHRREQHRARSRRSVPCSLVGGR